MNKKLFLKAVLDGLVQACFLFSLGVFTVYTDDLEQLILLFGALYAIIGVFLYCLFVNKVYNISRIVYFSLISILFCVLSYFLLLIIYTIMPINFLRYQEENISKGILILIASEIFILSSVVLRGCALVVLVVRRKHKKEIVNTCDGYMYSEK